MNKDYFQCYAIMRAICRAYSYNMTVSDKYEGLTPLEALSY